MPKAHKFAVVADDVLHHCFLLGLDFFVAHQIDIDLRFNSCKQDSQHIAILFPDNLLKEALASVLLCETDVHEMRYNVTSPHQVKISHVHDEVRFEVEGDSSTIVGLSFLLDDDTITYLIK